MNGDYVRTDTPMSDTLRSEWDEWLDRQRDPGLWDSYKVKDPKELPYVDGHPQWVTDAFMPDHLLEKLKKEKS